MKEEALLMVLWQPPAAYEEEFNAWYDTEHLPERACIEGFRTARRYVGLGDGPSHMALYDLSSLGILDEPPYQAISGDNYSPWSRRIMARIAIARRRYCLLAHCQRQVRGKIQNSQGMRSLCALP